MQQESKQLEYEEVLETLRDLVRATEYPQDFIFLTGLYRFEYHSKTKTFVCEQRMFDRVELDPMLEERAEYAEKEQVPAFRKPLKT